MQAIQRIEIVVDAPHAETVLRVLEERGVTSYSLIRGVSGRGERGLRLSDDITGLSNNNYILTTCASEELDELAEALRPVLERVGGMCLVSEARWLLH